MIRGTVEDDYAAAEESYKRAADSYAETERLEKSAAERAAATAKTYEETASIYRQTRWLWYAAGGIIVVAALIPVFRKKKGKKP